MILLGSKLTPDPGGHKLEHRNKEDQLQNSSSLKLEGIELRFLVCSTLIDLVNFIHMMPLGIKTGPTPGITSLNLRNKDVEFICGENDSGERSRAIMALLFFQVESYSVNRRIFGKKKVRCRCISSYITHPINQGIQMRFHQY